MSSSWKAAGKLVAEEILGHRRNLKLLLSQADTASSCTLNVCAYTPRKRLLSGINRETPALSEQK